MFLINCITVIQDVSFDEFRFGFIVISSLGVFIMKSLNISPEISNEYQIYDLLFIQKNRFKLKMGKVKPGFDHHNSNIKMFY